jgi:hypothetical protein
MHNTRASIAVRADYTADACRRERDRELHRAFEAGAYAAAYETEDYCEATQGLGRSSFSEAYRAAFTLGFFAVHERDEIPAGHLETYERALASEHGQRCVELGFADRCFLNAL